MVGYKEQAKGSAGGTLFLDRAAAFTRPILTGFGYLLRIELANQGQDVIPKPHPGSN